jgi:DNA-directed RNA polymerase specialized sigma24 family protein
MHAHSVLLLDECGQPLSPRLQDALLPLAPRLQRHFPTLTDECILTDVLEESGRRIAAREERKGPLDNLQAYAWVVARRMAALRHRCGEWAIASATLTSAESEMALRRIPAGFATSEQIYYDILCKELLAHLDPIERQIAKGKNAGQSDDEIARGCGTSRRTIFNAWRRLKRKMLTRAQGIGPRPEPLGWKGSRST